MPRIGLGSPRQIMIMFPNYYQYEKQLTKGKKVAKTHENIEKSDIKTSKRLQSIRKKYVRRCQYMPKPISTFFTLFPTILLLSSLLTKLSSLLTITNYAVFFPILFGLLVHYSLRRSHYAGLYIQAYQLQSGTIDGIQAQRSQQQNRPSC